LQRVISSLKSLSFYKNVGLDQANLMISNAQKSYESGSIAYLEYFQSLEYGIQLKLDHLNALNNYNQAVVKLQYLLGE
ncbi:MAG: TolC family protein, partial [Putridiphycobacter sp.]|nr:TolC family protein [Putridiphycobacter sp.]